VLPRFDLLHEVVLMLSALVAQDPAAARPQSPFGPEMFLIIGLFFLFYVVVLLPMNRRQRKEQEKLLASISRGSKIVTNSGIIGTVVTIKDGEPEIVIRSEDTKLRITRDSVKQVLGTDAAEAAK
jgi:preprotein translocase subunit YajC